MPERINVIRLSETERESLREVAAADDVKAISKVLTESLRVGGGGARAAAQSVEMDPGKFRAVRDDLTTRLRTLAALPVADEVKRPLVEKTERALSVVDEALAMLEEVAN